jgi:glycosyltransferase involved in cell wall biosynthesis
VVAPSRRFAEHLERDYGVPPERLKVVANPIDLERFVPGAQHTGDSGPLTILFVSRIAVRKGVEVVVALSHRLADLADQVHIEVVGEQSLWSDYRPLLEDLNPRVANYFGGAGPELPELYRSAALLMQPAHYEPFALTVGEALASGRPVVASDEVGASEGVDSRCCRVFPAGDLDALEMEVRGLVNELRNGAGAELGRIARSEAERLFDPSTVAARLARVLAAASRASAPD